jgi:uncharacterized membrane protein (DUF373 family)
VVEPVRLLIVYPREHHVAVDFMVELGIVSILREIVLHGVVEFVWQHIVALAVFLLALGLMLRFGDLRERIPAPGVIQRLRAETTDDDLAAQPATRNGGAG